MSFVDSVRLCLSDNYFKFSGRASRSEFWWFYLASVLVLIVCVVGEGVVLAPSELDENEYGVPFTDPEI